MVQVYAVFSTPVKKGPLPLFPAEKAFSAPLTKLEKYQKLSYFK
jgi:hypothetical protein